MMAKRQRRRLAAWQHAYIAQATSNLRVEISCVEQLESRLMLSSTNSEPAGEGIEYVKDAATPELQTLPLDRHDAGDSFDVAGTLSNQLCMLPAEPKELVQQDYEHYAAMARVGAAGNSEDSSGGESIPLSDTFFLHSAPTATKTIYIDFDGNTTIGTSWNSNYRVGTIRSPAYDPDGNGASFTDNELLRIQQIWKRVAEDFIAFDVDVTTQDPGQAALVNSGRADTRWGMRVVVTVDNFTTSGAGGYAYVDSFNWNSQSAGATDTPCFVFNTSEIGVAFAVSHEAGHTLGLSHDGTTAANPIQPSAGYYKGHGSGETGWGPIMGSSYDHNVTTWDQGEYFGSNNTGVAANYGRGASDIAIITTRNGFGLRPDDHGNTTATATSVNYVGPDNVNPSLFDISLFGVIEDRNDLDFIKFETGDGLANITIDSYVSSVWTSNGDETYSQSIQSTFFNGTTWSINQGSNLDIQAELYDAAGRLIATSSSSGLSARFTNQNLAAGTYYISIDGAGFGTPSSSTSPTGYTDYASTGQYLVSGTVVPATLKLSSVAVDADKSESNTGRTEFIFNITMSQAQTMPVTVDWAVTDMGLSLIDIADFGGIIPIGQVTFAPGVRTIPVSIFISGDTDVETDEVFVVLLSNSTAGDVFGAAHGIIRNDDVPIVKLNPMDLQQKTSRPTVSWAALPDMVYYDLWIDNRSTGQTQVVRETHLTATSWMPSGDLPMASYRVWIRGIDAGGTSTIWSIPTDFNIVPTPMITGPSSPTRSLRPALTWTSIPGATSHTIWIRNATTQQNQYHLASSTTPSYTPTADFEIGRFIVWLRSVNASGLMSAWSSPVTLNITAPVTLNPMSLRQETARPVISWTALPGAVRYVLSIDNQSTGQTQVVREIDLTTTSWTPSGDLPMAGYRAGVRGIDAEGVASNWSAPVDFNVIPAPLITGPRGPVQSLRPEFTWDSVAGATSYNIWIRNATTQEDVYKFVSSLTPTFTPPEDLEIGGFAIRLQSVSAEGLSSKWAAPAYIRITTPVTLNPIPWRQPTPLPTISWAALPGAVSYDLRIDNRSTGETQIVREGNLTTTSWTPPNDLPMAIYRAWVRGIDAKGVAGSWSSPINFNVVPAPVLVSPWNATFNQTPEFGWTTVAGAASYEIQVKNPKDGTTLFQSMITSNSFVSPIALPDGPYTWRVRAISQWGHVSQFTAQNRLYIGGQPTILSPSETASNTPIFSWLMVEGASSYQLRVDKVDQEQTTVINVSGLVSDTYQISTPLASGAYRFWVRAVSPSGKISIWSRVTSFTISGIT